MVWLEQTPHIIRLHIIRWKIWNNNSNDIYGKGMALPFVLGLTSAGALEGAATERCQGFEGSKFSSSWIPIKMTCWTKICSIKKEEEWDRKPIFITCRFDTWSWTLNQREEREAESILFSRVPILILGFRCSINSNRGGGTKRTENS